MNNRKLLVFALLSATVLAVPMSTYAALEDSVVAASRAECRALGVDLIAANECYYKLAILADDVRICDEIRWAARGAACRRNILYSKPWELGALLPQSVLPIFVLLFLLVFIKKPPRSTFISGMLIGCAIAGVVLFVSASEIEWLKVMAPYMVYITIPTDGLLLYAPVAFLQLPYSAQLLSVHAILYGTIFGLFLHGEKEGYRVGAFIFLLALMFAYWEHPALSFIHSGLDILRS